MLNWFLLSLVAFGAFTNVKVDMRSDLNTNNVRQSIDITASADKSMDHYEIVLPSSAAFIQVKLDSSQGKQILPLIKEGLNYRVDLGRTVGKGESIDLNIKLVWTKASAPFPKEITQTDSEQMYEFLGNMHFYSPYLTKKESHTVKYS